MKTLKHARKPKKVKRANKGWGKLGGIVPADPSAGFKLPAFIRVNRRKLGLTQLDLSKRLKVAESAVQAWEAGTAVPKAENIPPLAKVIKADPAVLAVKVEQYRSNGR